IVLFEDDRIVEYDYSILDEIEPAFAITIHKSQGSEFPVVIMPVFQGPQVLMTRNLLYTAITRAKKLVILVGNEYVLGGMVENQREMFRYSGLREKLEVSITGNFNPWAKK
ncbi:MAG: ATP-dependent RecD-like DNA helicase, partial [Bacillota bacterium]|nr:ATP-dependent RecD-like DNA helicase [Bacillota bacterium]